MGRGGKAAALPATAASLTAATTLAAAALVFTPASVSARLFVRFAAAGRE